MRPVFVNETLGHIDGDYAPRYDIEYDGGVINGAKLTLANEIVAPGTTHNAAVMNNLFDFDNLASMRGNRLTTQSVGSSVVETIKDSVSNVTNASRVATFVGNQVTEVTTIYSDDGSQTLRRTTVTTTFESDGRIEEVIS
jgi:hypothetical protein